MGSDGRRSVPRPQSEPVCPSCGRPVGTAIKRRKVLGAYVPVWGPAPCHNTECDACVTEEPEEKPRSGRSFKGKHRRTHRPEARASAADDAAAGPAAAEEAVAEAAPAEAASTGEASTAASTGEAWAKTAAAKRAGEAGQGT
ncbi:hypothetical protein [Streptomyces sp. NPDC059063]|uniref:hypothetical protein n=1 Tax=unclassified Streptomyces TaxID=2593676 RepID=UPI0036879C55